MVLGHNLKATVWDVYSLFRLGRLISQSFASPTIMIEIQSHLRNKKKNKR